MTQQPNSAVAWLAGHLAEGRSVALVSVAVEHHEALIASGLIAGAVLEPPPPAREGCIVVVDDAGVEWAAHLSA